MQRAAGHGAIPEGWQRRRLGDVAEVAFSGVDKRTVEGWNSLSGFATTPMSCYNRRIRDFSWT